MPDYGHDLKFGYFLIPDSGDPSGVLATARLIDELGYDLVGIQDHPYHPGHLDSPSLMAVILGQTRRIRAFYSVANLGLRPPVMLAKAAASLDQLSGGRFELGLGTGAFREAIASMGGVDRSPGENLQALADQVAGATPEHIRAQIESLQTSSPLWKLRVNCLYYCRVVHAHHSIEDAMMFPALQQVNPDLGPVVDDSTGIRERIVTALGGLATDLLAHLAFEEEALGPTILELEEWP